MISLITAMIATSVAAGVGTWLCHRRVLVKEYEWLSKNGINVPRRPNERLTDWAVRIRVAQDELFDATTEFIAAVRTDGTVECVGERGEILRLSPTHPASIRLERARGHHVVIGASNPYRD